MSASAVSKEDCGPSGAIVQCREREGSCSLKAAHPLALLLVVESDAGPEYLCLLSVHPADSSLYGLAESITMLHEFGHVFARHERHAEAVRRAVKAWGLEVWCRDARSYSPAVTVVAMSGRSRCRRLPAPGLDHFNVSLAMGQNKLAGKAFRFGHLGYTNDATIIGALDAVEMGLELAQVPARPALHRRAVFWSQHYDVPINYVGHPETWDEIVTEGDVMNKDCVLRFKRNGRVSAVASIFRDLESLQAEVSMERAAEAQDRA